MLRRTTIVTALLAAAPPAHSEVTLDRVVVSATREERPALDVPAAVQVIEREQIRDGQLRVNLSEALTVPGVVVLNRQNYAQDLQISIRGFGARSTFGVRGVRLYVDGVPATFPDGQGQVSHFPLNAAERIEVLRGPFSALYGNASGGVIALTTELKPQPQRFEPAAAYGSDQTWRAGLNAVGGEGNYAFALDANRFATDGYRDHSAARRDTVSLRTAFLDSPLGAARISLSMLEMPDTQDPLGLSRQDLAANPDPRQASPNALLFNTRKTTRQSTLGADLQSRLGERARLSTTAWIGTRGVTQFQAIPPGTQIPASSPGGVIDFDRVYGGTDVRATLESTSLTTSVGVAVEAMREHRRGYQNFVGAPASPTELGVLGSLRRDEINHVESIDPYAQLEWRLAQHWIAHAGVRASNVRFRSKDRFLSNGDDSGSASFHAVNPTAGLVFKPGEGASVYVSYGRGFETPTLNELAYRLDAAGNAVAGLNTELRPARSHNLEAGIKLRPAQTLAAELAVFTIKTNDEIVVRSNAGGRSTFRNVARTRRDGAEAILSWRPGAWSATLGAAYIDARFDSDFLTCGPAPCTTPNLPVAAGNSLPGVPAASAFFELTHRAAWFDTTLSVRGQSRIAVDDRNTDHAGGYAIASLAVARTFEVGKTRPRLFVRVDNLFDKPYFGSVIVNEANGRFFEPAPGRTWLAGVDWRL
ncbi:MAG TPA: TonB-dependent receptor [Burkholderiaceae bacterium]|nr:TonB-dependent receptor [Burkholderiaceae bacterium]